MCFSSSSDITNFKRCYFEDFPFLDDIQVESCREKKSDKPTLYYIYNKLILSSYITSFTDDIIGFTKLAIV